jgi:tetratricopeptide (TPR) repeat protein
MTDRLVFAKINGWEDTLAAQKWGIRGYPTLILMSAEGVEVDRVAGYLPPMDFIQTMDDYLAGRGTLEDLTTRFADAPDSLWLEWQIAQKYQYRGSDSLAEATYRDVIDADPGNRSGVADSSLHALAMVAYSAGAEHYDTAIARFAAVRTRFPNSPLAEDAETYVPYILARQEKYDRALSKYEKFLADFPNSSEVGWVNRQIESVKKKMENP